MEIRELPPGFPEKMKALLGASFDDYLKSFDEPPCAALRVNTARLSPQAFLTLAGGAGWELAPVPWTENGFYYEETLRPARHPWYFAGLYYLQEPSAMAPAALLPVSPGDRVLDLCAAPGGKSTELAARLNGSGFLCSNDISSSRARALLKNLELHGAANSFVTSEPPERLAEVFPEFFNRILVDAPCSGEGMFRRDPAMRKSYLARGPEEYVPLQKQIAAGAVRMLAPGGLLLYSTCTFDERENEGVIRWLLETFPELSLTPLPLRPGFAKSASLPGCVRLFPHLLRGEGHFAALLKKRGDGENKPDTRDAFSPAADRAAKEARDFLSESLRAWESDRFFRIRDQLFYLPYGLPSPERMKGLRCLRTGLFLGTEKNGRFEPSQALAMSLRPDEWAHSLNLSSQEERAVRYLKGESLSLTQKEEAALPDGRILVGVDGFSLGWAKKRGNFLKNGYFPGWRWQ